MLKKTILNMFCAQWPSQPQFTVNVINYVSRASDEEMEEKSKAIISLKA
jgi:hypothetical protein